MNCPCSSELDYEKCCQPIIEGQIASTAEQLMRARYTAYTQVNMDFIKKTHDPKTIKNCDMEENRKWAEQTQWKNLEIIRTEKGQKDDQTGLVEFKAEYTAKTESGEHREVSTFNKKNGQWFFTDGKPPESMQLINTEPKVGRNDPCPCGSGKKYKKCCA